MSQESHNPKLNEVKINLALQNTDYSKAENLEAIKQKYLEKELKITEMDI